jgi:hypothetical protein
VGARFVEVEQGGASRHRKRKVWTFSPSPVSCCSLTHPCTRNSAASSSSTCTT